MKERREVMTFKEWCKMCEGERLVKEGFNWESCAVFLLCLVVAGLIVGIVLVGK